LAVADTANLVNQSSRSRVRIQNIQNSKDQPWHLEVAALAHGTIVFATTWLLFLSCASFCAVARMKISCFLASTHCLFHFLADKN